MYTILKNVQTCIRSFLAKIFGYQKLIFFIPALITIRSIIIALSIIIVMNICKCITTVEKQTLFRLVYINKQGNF